MRIMATRVLLTLVMAMLTSCAGPGEHSPGDARTDAGPDSTVKEVIMAYSAKFIISDPAKSRMVLDFRKHYDAKTMEKVKDVLADTVALEIPGLKLRTYRDTFNSLKTEMHLVMSVREPDKGDDWVLVWAVARYTDEAQAEHAMKVQQVWGLNKAGKVSLIEQFDRVLK